MHTTNVVVDVADYDTDGATLTHYSYTLHRYLALFVCEKNHKFNYSICNRFFLLLNRFFFSCSWSEHFQSVFFFLLIFVHAVIALKVHV